MTVDPTTLERDIDAAEARYQAALADLTRPDGAPRYSPAEHTERETAAHATFRRDLAALNDRLGAIVTDARAELLTVAASDPTKGFTTSELERVNLRTSIVTEDLRQLPEDVQVARLRAALTSGERAERYIALRAGRAVLAEREREQRRNDNRGVPMPDYSALAAIVRELEAGFIDSASRERAEERIAAAERVSAQIGVRHYMASTYGTGRQRATPAGR